jgi:hypothetical protein
MNWNELLKKYKENHLRQNLKTPNRRLSAQEKLISIIQTNFPEIKSNPSLLLKIDKKDFKEKLSKYKSNGKLNSAEESVVNGWYKILNNEI